MRFEATRSYTLRTGLFYCTCWVGSNKTNKNKQFPYSSLPRKVWIIYLKNLLKDLKLISMYTVSSKTLSSNRSVRYGKSQIQIHFNWKIEIFTMKSEQIFFEIENNEYSIILAMVRKTSSVHVESRFICIGHEWSFTTSVRVLAIRNFFFLYFSDTFFISIKISNLFFFNFSNNKPHLSCSVKKCYSF